MSTTTELARAAFLQASLQTARRDYAAHARANGYSIRQQLSREETAESTVLFNDDYRAAFGGEDRVAMLAGLESTGPSKPDLRIAAVYRLMGNGRITSRTRATELLAQRAVKPAVIDHWIAGPFKHLPIAR